MVDVQCIHLFITRPVCIIRDLFCFRAWTYFLSKDRLVHHNISWKKHVHPDQHWYCFRGNLEAAPGRDGWMPIHEPFGMLHFNLTLKILDCHRLRKVQSGQCSCVLYVFLLCLSLFLSQGHHTPERESQRLHCLFNCLYLLLVSEKMYIPVVYTL